MDLQVKGKNYEVSPSIRAYAELKLGKAPRGAIPGALFHVWRSSGNGSTARSVGHSRGSPRRLAW